MLFPGFFPPGCVLPRPTDSNSVRKSRFVCETYGFNEDDTVSRTVHAVGARVTLLPETSLTYSVCVCVCGSYFSHPKAPLLFHVFALLLAAASISRAL